MPPVTPCAHCQKAPCQVVIRWQGGGNKAKYCSDECRYAAQQERLAVWRKTPRGRYVAQRNNAKRRGIQFNLSYMEWLEFWGDDVERIGKHKGDLVMGRYGDVGPYSPGNCYKSEHVENWRHAPLVS